MSGTYISKIPVLVVALVIGIVLVTSAVVPLASDYSEAKTFKNEGIYYMVNPTDAMTVKYIGGTDWQIDGELLDYTPAGATNIIVTDSIFIRNIGQVRGDVYATWTAADLTISNGAITGTATTSGGDVTVNYSYEWIYVATNEKSPYIMTDSTKNAYIKDDSELNGFGLTNIKDSDGNNQFVTFKVDVNDLTATVSCSANQVTISDISLNTEEVAGYIDLYKFSSVTFNAHWGDYTTACTYNVLIAPSEVTADPDNPAAYKNLVKVVPLMAFIMLVVAAAGMVYFKNKD